MAITSGQTITHTDLNTESAENRATLTTAAQHSSRSMRNEIHVTVLDMDNTAAQALMGTLYFTPDDDYVIVGLAVTVRDSTGGPIITATVECEDDSTYFNEGTLTVSITSTGTAPDSTRVQYTDTTGERHVLLRGVEYKLTLTSNSATVVELAQATLQVESRMRRR